MTTTTEMRTASRIRGRCSRVEATRTHVLRHTERLFAHKGYNATTLRELAKVSGVRMLTIH